MTSRKVLAETVTYYVTTETVKSPMTLSGEDDVYAVVNKETGVVEGRTATLPEAMNYMSNVQTSYDTMSKKAE